MDARQKADSKDDGPGKSSTRLSRKDNCNRTFFLSSKIDSSQCCLHYIHYSMKKEVFNQSEKTYSYCTIFTSSFSRFQFETRKYDRLYSCQLPKGRSDLSGGLKTVFQGPSFHPKIASKSILDRYQVGAHLAPATLARQWKI